MAAMASKFYYVCAIQYYNLLGACRHKVVVSAFLGIRRFPTLLEDFPNTIFSKFFSSSKILLLESPLNFHGS